MFTTLNSIKDEKVVEARALGSFHERSRLKRFLCEGEMALRWALDSPCQLLYAFIHDKQKDHPFVQELAKASIPLYLASDGILKKISDTNYLIPFLGVVQAASKVSDEPSCDLVVVLDGVQDLGNIGTIVRTASAFGIREFVSTKQEGDFFYAKTIDASRGTVFQASLHHASSPSQSIEALKRLGYQIVVTTPHASLIQSFAPLQKKKMALVMGNETHGASREMLDAADVRIQIPMSGEVESLNVAVAAGISLYEMKIQWVLRMLTEKIQGSVGRALSIGSRLMRMVFDSHLKASCPIDAEQAIILMILQCEPTGTRESLHRDSGAKPTSEFNALFDPLIVGGWVKESSQGELTITEQGSQLLSKIWTIHEKVESQAFYGVSESDKATFLKVLEMIRINCEKNEPYS